MLLLWLFSPNGHKVIRVEDNVVKMVFSHVELDRNIMVFFSHYARRIELIPGLFMVVFTVNKSLFLSHLSFCDVIASRFALLLVHRLS